jgi:hypothetical protein
LSPAVVMRSTLARRDGRHKAPFRTCPEGPSRAQAACERTYSM